MTTRAMEQMPTSATLREEYRQYQEQAMVQSAPPLASYEQWLEVRVAIAVMEERQRERERCAKIAEEQAADPKSYKVETQRAFHDGWVDASTFVAAKIRSGE